MSPEGTPAVVSLHAVTDDEEARPVIDRDRARAAVADLLVALGQDLDSPHLAETPRRAADALIELLTPEPFRATTFPNDEGYDTSSSSRGSRSTRSASTTCSRSAASPTSATCRATGSSACRSSRASWSSPLGRSRCRSG